jgi:alanine racemase
MYTLLQITRFKEAVDAIRTAGIDPGILHCANSGAVFMYPEAEFDMIRPGIIIYGYYPDDSVRQALEEENRLPELRPVMELLTKVVAIKTVQPGQSISYGRTWTAEEETDIATLPIGYADGFFRRFSQPQIPDVDPYMVSIRGKQYPIVGRVCMDQCMVNLGRNHDVRRWDDVILFGPQQAENAGGIPVTADTVAQRTGTISYEILCGISARVPRIHVGL